MNWLKTMIISDPAVLAVMMIIIIALLYLIYKNRKDIIFRAALCAVSKAEETWSSSTGKIKFAEVYVQLKKQFPIVTFFLPEEQLSQLIEDALLELKAILAYKKSLEKND